MKAPETKLAFRVTVTINATICPRFMPDPS